MPIGSNDWEGLALSGGRYLITAKLGEGGMGFVYRAIDQNIESEVVIKIPRQAMMDDPEFAGRFTREIRSLVKLSHPHIVKVTDVGTWEGTPFAVMQYLPGGSLEEQRPVGPDGQVLPCDPKNVSRWLVAVAEALDYIHVQGYVHRDVKPGNILFDALGHAFLSDFGVAKVLASSTNAAPAQTAMTGAGMVLGTPEYMAPELIMGEPFDGRVDQYALAITAYEMLCGRRPFEDGTKTKVLVLHTSKAPPPLTAWCQTVPERLSQAVLKGLAKQPAQRYATCALLAKAIATAAESAVPRDDRVRLTCPACGRAGSLSVADFAKLKAGGGRASCPGCKSPIDLSSSDIAAPGAVSGGTMKFSFTGISGDYPVASAPPTAGGGTTAFTAVGGSTSVGNKMPPAPPQERAATVAMSASGGHAPQTASGQSRSTPRRGSATLIESALPPSADAAGPATFKTLAVADAERSGSHQEQASAENAKLAANKKWVWIASGAGAATLLLAMVSFALFPSSSRKEPVPDASPRAATTQVQTPGSGANTPQTPPGSSTKLSSAASLAKNNDTSRPGASSTSSGSSEQPTEGVPEPPRPADELVAAEHRPAVTKKQRPVLRKNRGKSAAPNSQPPRPSGVFANRAFDPGRLPKKSRQLDYSVEKILAKALAYRDEIVVPGGMYCLTRSGADHQAGNRKYTVTECALKEQGPQKKLHMTSLWSKEMEVEPSLAGQLDTHWGALEGRVAILTVWITSTGESGIVRAEILQKFTPRLKPGYGPGQADIDYEVLFVSPDGSKSAKADDADWQRVGRLNHLYLHHKHLVQAYRQRLQSADMTRLSSQMNGLYADMMKGMAADAAAQRSLQRSISGR